jgi:hypothetical protein
VSIGVGRYYVDGILVENDSVCDYAQQWDYTPDPQNDPLIKALAAQQQTGTFGLYLDVWERHISAVEDDDIREKALGGPDTCSRSKVVWQVKAMPVEQGADCAVILKELESNPSRPLLNAQLDPGAAPKDPCTLSPDARYRGAENQLYRLEIHRGGAGSQATFKWSRDNGSVLTSWIQSSGNDLVVGSTRGFTAGNWVELLDDATELNGNPGPLVKLTKVQGDRLTVDPGSWAGAPLSWSTQLKHPRVRRWDEFDNPDGHASLADDNAVAVVESDLANPTWITLEDGIQIQFVGNSAKYQTGDYWLIPARVATGQIEWPPAGDDPNAPFSNSAREPWGIEHHYAPLAVLSLSGQANTVLTMCPCILNVIADCSENSQVTTSNDLTSNRVPIRPAPAPAPVPAPAPAPRTNPRRPRTPRTPNP